MAAQRWFVQRNDLVGGWCIANADRPASELDRDNGECLIGDFLWFEDAYWIVTHRERLFGFPRLLLTITCPACSKTSWNVNDVRHGFCGSCEADSYGRIEAKPA